MSSGGWRTQPLLPGWAATRARILARDGHRCQWPGGCPEPATDVDHVIGAAAGGGDEDANLASLCRGHHRRKTGFEAGQRGGLAAGVVRREIASRKYRQPERHPGLKRPEGE